MDTKAVQEKLQGAYHSMLDHIEELVDKDKTPLKEAFATAEEKLSEWHELSREEIDDISEALKEHLSDVGVASHQLNESLKETLSFDASYAASSIWNKLSKVADKTVLELSELRKDLRENLHGNIIHKNLYENNKADDPSHYSEEQQKWFSDAMQWQGDYETALHQVDQIRTDLRKRMRRTNAFSKAVINKSATEVEYDFLSEDNVETTQAINNLYYDLQRECE